MVAKNARSIVIVARSTVLMRTVMNSALRGSAKIVVSCLRETRRLTTLSIATAVWPHVRVVLGSEGMDTLDVDRVNTNLVAHMSAVVIVARAMTIRMVMVRTDIRALFVLAVERLTYTMPEMANML